MNVSLIGMAGAGKSFFGKRLSERFGMTFLDNDASLRQQYGKGIQELLDELGEEKYLEAEEKMLIASTRGKDNLIISPGGSVVYRNGAMDHLKDMSVILYLHVPFETVDARLKDASPRAIIGLGRNTLRELYDERQPLYALHADHTVDVAGRSDAEIVNDIVRLLGIDNGHSFASL